MGYAVESAQWPKSVTTPISKLFDLFFSLIDERSEIVGERLATDVFTRDGIFMATSGTFKGSDDIRTCRKGVWKTVLSRRHEIRKAFLYDDDDDSGNVEILLTGVVTVEDLQHQRRRHEFIVRTSIAYAETISPKIQRYQVLIPMLKHDVSIFE